MKVNRALAAILVALMLLPTAAMADSLLKVQGSATVTVPPDMAVLSVGVSNEDENSSTAQQRTADAITAVVDAIKKAGLSDEDIATSYLNTYPVYNYTDEGQSLRGFRVEHMLSVTVKDVEAVGAVLDAALAAGANDTRDIAYKTSRESAVYEQALALAVENASEKASALAIAAGVWLGSLDQINEVSNSVGILYAEKAMYDGAGGASLGSTLMAGNIDVTANVELVYEVR